MVLFDPPTSQAPCERNDVTALLPLPDVVSATTLGTAIEPDVRVVAGERPGMDHHGQCLSGVLTEGQGVESRPSTLPVREEQGTTNRSATKDPVRSSLTLLNLRSVELVASLFSSFRDVGRFHQTLITLPGVHAVRLRRLEGGVLRVRVECRSADELLDALSMAWPPSAPFHVLAHEAQRIEIAFVGAAETRIEREVRAMPG